jgi:hypothetical protein
MTLTMPEQMTSIEPDIDAEAERLIGAVQREGLGARLIGGMAIRLLAGDRLHPAYRRPIRDLDFVVSKNDRRGLDALITSSGYAPQERFNALHGARRLLYDDPANGRQIDVFVEHFEMCHELPLAESIAVRPHTLPAADVLMTKLQIVHLNEKDRGDLYALLLSHSVSAGEPDAIDLQRITSLTGNDWGLQHTFELNLDRLREALDAQPISDEERHAIAQRIEILAQAMDNAPKSRRWKIRARVGERKQWYEEPEEVNR